MLRPRPLPACLGRRALPALLGALLLWAPAAFAWNAAGHRLGARIAWQALDADTRERVAALLHAHADFARWSERTSGDDRERDAFVEASTWADEIRDDARFADDGDSAGTAPTPPGFPDRLRHRNWHFIDLPVTPSPGPLAGNGELRRQLPRLAAIVGDSGRAGSERAWALVWLIHLVGDAHQPLHVGSRFDAAGESDRGGNAVRVNNPFLPRKPSATLHAYWDDLPGPPWLRGEALEHAAAALLAAYPPPAAHAGIGDWLAESLASARDDAYPAAADNAATVDIDADFNARSREIAQRRVVWSGYRLAELLQQLLGGR